MPVITQPIQETYFYKEVRKTQPGVGVVYPGYPIYHLYKNVPTGTPVRLNTDIEYWMPLPGLTVYKEYQSGDENVSAERTKYEPRLELGVKKGRRYYSDRFSVYTHKYCGTKLYVATNRTKLYPLSPTTNPYSYRNIQVWVESPETYENTYDSYGTLIVPSYWYHPFDNLFYPFGNLQTFGISDSQYLIDSMFSRDTSGQSDQSLMANAAESIRIAQIEELMSAGRSRDEAVALINANAQAALATRAARSLIKPDSITSRQPVKSQNISVNVRASSLGGVSASSVSISASQNPKLVQTTTAGLTPLEYEFLHRPNQITYSNIGSEWSPIDRAANRPMIDWKAYKLMNVSFSFIVAADETGSLDAAVDGKVITTSVDSELKTLRQMASSPFPVLFMGFDGLLQEPSRYPFNKDAGNTSLFVIADFSVTSIYRSSTGAISRASCEMTLSEYPKEMIKLIEFPKLKPIPEVPPPPPGQKKICDNTLASATHGNANAYVTGKTAVPGADAFLRGLAKQNIIVYKPECDSIAVLDTARYAELYGVFQRQVGWSSYGKKDIMGPVIR